MEIVPPITLADFKTIKLTRLTAEVTDAEIDKALQTIADQNRPFVAKAEGAAKGRSRHHLVSGHDRRHAVRRRHRRGRAADLGSGQFIPGFEEHLVGLKAGESKTFDVKFPDDYRASILPARTRRLPSP